ncbi:MAG: anthrone oxygenase family protein [Mycobacterium sp.]
MTDIAGVVAILILGPLVGVEFGVTAFTHPLLGRLSDDGYRQTRSHSSRVLGRVMPFWYAAAVLAVVAALVVTPTDPLVVAALVMMVALMALTFAVLVPINNRVGAWATEGDVSRELASRWDRVHWVRVGLLFAAFVLVVLARFG